MLVNFIFDIVQNLNIVNEIKCVSFHDDYHNINIDVSNKLGSLTNCKELSYQMNDKFFMRSFSNKIFIPIEYCLLKDYQEREVRTPFILKPFKDSTGSKDVYLVNNLKDYDLKSYQQNSFICEEFVVGQEYSVDTISYNGQHKVLMIAKKFLFKDSFVEKSHIIGDKSIDNIWLQVETKIQKFLTEINYTNGLSHIEIKINSSGIYFIECQLRMGGDYLWRAFELITGQCLAKLSYAVCEDSSFHIEQVKTTFKSTKIIFINYYHCHIDNIDVSKVAKVKFKQLDSIQLLDSVYEVHQLSNKINLELKSSSCRNLAIILQSNDLQNILTDTEKIEQMLELEIHCKFN